MKKLLASIIVLITATTISFIQPEVDSNNAVETEDIGQEVLVSEDVSVFS